MFGVKGRRRASALGRKPISDFSQQRRRLDPSPFVRGRATMPARLAASIPDRSVTEELLDEEFDELGCELSTLLRVATLQ